MNGRCIIKLKKDDQEWYLEWSSTIDAPITFAMSKEEMTIWLRKQRWFDFEIENLMKQLDKTGCGLPNVKSVEDLIKDNRAGENKECLTYEQIVEKFCLKQDATLMEG